MHCAHVGHPIAGDVLYGGGEDPAGERAWRGEEGAQRPWCAECVAGEVFALPALRLFAAAYEVPNLGRFASPRQPPWLAEWLLRLGLDLPALETTAGPSPETADGESEGSDG